VDAVSLRLFDDAEAMLAELRLHGFRLGVLTNCDDREFEAIHRTFARPFDLFVTSNRVGGYKPSRWHFRAFELITRVARHDWVHVGCSVYHDVGPAEAFGVSGVWLDRHRTAEDPCATSAHVRSTANLVDIVVDLLDRRVELRNGDVTLRQPQLVT
jgi:2-haloacid dehalogenase